MKSAAAIRYRELMNELFWERAQRTLTQDDEEHYAVALNDCRAGMSDDEQKEIEKLLGPAVGEQS